MLEVRQDTGDPQNCMSDCSLYKHAGDSYLDICISVLANWPRLLLSRLQRLPTQTWDRPGIQGNEIGCDCLRSIRKIQSQLPRNRKCLTGDLKV